MRDLHPLASRAAQAALQPRGGRLSDEPHYLGHRQRLRERFLKEPDALPDYEMLELVLCMAQPRRDMKPLAKALIDKFGSYANVICASPEALAEVDGVKDATIATLKIVRESATRLSQADLKSRPILSSWQALIDYCRGTMGRESVEQFRVFFLDRKNGLIADERQQRGTVDQTAVYPREVVKRALELGASALIIAHNHPSGDTTPSRGDIDMTRQIKEACDKLGIALHDHVIISRSSTTSFKSLGLI